MKNAKSWPGEMVKSSSTVINRCSHWLRSEKLIGNGIRIVVLDLQTRIFSSDRGNKCAGSRVACLENLSNRN